MAALRIGIVGCGAGPNRYYLPALKRYPQIYKNLYLVDKNRAQAENLAKKFGGSTVFDNHQEIIDKVDGVIVAVPNSLHYSVSMDFLTAGVNVLCEKPLAESVKEAGEMNAVAKKNGVSLCVNNTRRIFPSFQKIKELIATGRIGQIKSIKYHEGTTFAWDSSTGFYVDPKLSSKGIVMDVGSHVLDLICWWLDGKPKLIECEDDSFGGPESVARIKAEAKDCTIDIFLNRLNDLDNLFRIIGELGSIESEPLGWQKLRIQLNSGQMATAKIKCVAKSYPDFVIPIVDNFLKVIEGKETPLISGIDVENSIALIDEYYKKRRRFKLPWYEELGEIVENK